MSDRQEAHSVFSVAVPMAISGRSSTSERVAQRIRAQLATGELNPGDRLWEADLARAFGVSRSPVREALMWLTSEGLLVSKPYRGTFVAPLNAERFVELLDFRLVLEEFAVRRLSARARVQDFEALAAGVAALHDRVRTAGFAEAIAADLEFHLLLIDLAGNEPLRVSYASMIHEFQLYIRLTTRHYASTDDLAHEHDRFIDALRTGRVDEAVELMREHIKHGLEHTLEDLQRYRAAV